MVGKTVQRKKRVCSKRNTQPEINLLSWALYPQLQSICVQDFFRDTAHNKGSSSLFSALLRLDFCCWGTLGSFLELDPLSWFSVEYSSVWMQTHQQHPKGNTAGEHLWCLWLKVVCRLVSEELMDVWSFSPKLSRSLLKLRLCGCANLIGHPVGTLLAQAQGRRDKTQ